MGLFGYNKKQFAKNTALMKDDVQEKMKKVYSIGDPMNVGALLNTVVLILGKENYPAKAGGKTMEAIDARVFGLLEKIDADLQAKNLAKAYEHCLIVIGTLESERAFGKTVRSAEDMQLLEDMAEFKGQICNALDEKGKLSAKKDSLIAKARGTDKATQLKIKLEYDRLAKEERSCDAIVNMNVSRYNAALEVANTRKIGTAARQIESHQLVSPKEFAREAAKYSEIIEREHAKDTEIVGIGADFMSGVDESLSDTPSSTEFFDRLNESESGSVAGAIDNSEAGADDDFWKELGNKN